MRKSRIAHLLMLVIAFGSAACSCSRPKTMQTAAPPKANVLILCTGNSARSQMAEGFVKHYASDRFAVHSAGMKPAARVNPFAVQAMRELGIDISVQYPKHADEFLGKMPVAYLITVCAAADSQCPAVISGVDQRLHWPFDDPAAIEGTDEEKLVGFRRIRDEIQGKIKTWVDSLPQ
jgi:arsenate reductase